MILEEKNIIYKLEMRRDNWTQKEPLVEENNLVSSIHLFFITISYFYHASSQRLANRKQLNIMSSECHVEWWFLPFTSFEYIIMFEAVF